MTHDAGGGPSLTVESSGRGVPLGGRALDGGGGGGGGGSAAEVGSCLDQDEVARTSERHTLTAGVCMCACVSVRVCV